MIKNESGERRLEVRYPASGKVLFIVNKRKYQGLLKNCSVSGACINQKNFLYSGNSVTVTLPEEDEQRSGEVVWSNGKSFGIRFEE